MEVNCLGQIVFNNKPVKQYNDKDGYKIIAVRHKGKTLNKKVHRLIAEKYIINPLNKKQVNHKNGIKSDNTIKNLEWVTQSENLKHSYKYLGRTSPAKNKSGKEYWLSKHVCQISLDGFFINEFDSATDAEKQTKINAQSIRSVRTGRLKKAGGYIWI
jgi:hypothetical protein